MNWLQISPIHVDLGTVLCPNSIKFQFSTLLTKSYFADQHPRFAVPKSEDRFITSYDRTSKPASERASQHQLWERTSCTLKLQGRGASYGIHVYITVSERVFKLIDIPIGMLTIIIFFISM